MFPLEQRELIRGADAHVRAGLGVAADYVADHVPLRCPKPGRVTHFGNAQTSQGGLWVRLSCRDGDIIEFAHMSERVPEGEYLTGQQLGITGNTGTVTTNPHLHVQIFRYGKRLDPEQYDWRTEIPITVMGLPGIGWIDLFKKNVEKWSRGDITVSIRFLPSAREWYISQLEVLNLRNAHAPNATFFMVYCSPAPTFYRTWGDRIHRCMMAVVGMDPRASSFEFSHMLTRWHNMNRRKAGLPFVRNEDYLSASDEKRYEKYDIIKPYLGYIESGYPEVVQEDMYELFRDPNDKDEVYATRSGAKRHIVNATTLRVGAEAPDQLWEWTPDTNIPVADKDTFAALVEGAELLLLPPDA